MCQRHCYSIRQNITDPGESSSALEGTAEGSRDLDPIDDFAGFRQGYGDRIKCIGALLSTKTFCRRQGLLGHS